MDDWKKKSVMIFCLMIIATIIIGYAGVSYYNGNQSEYNYGIIEDKVEYESGFILVMENGDLIGINELSQLGNNPLKVGTGFVYHESTVIGKVNN